MFQGEEVGAIVIDIGSSVTKAGYAGDDHPKAVFPSAVGVRSEGGKFVGEGMDVIGEDNNSSSSNNSGVNNKYFLGTETLSARLDNTQILFPSEHGLIKDWEIAEKIWGYGMNRLRIDPKEHPLLMVEPSYNTRQNRERMTEMGFEKYEVPAMFVAKDAVLTCFASGRATGLVLDSGAGKTSVVPVYDGYALQHSIVRSSFAGDRLDHHLHRIIQSKFPSSPILPHYLLKKDPSLPHPSLLSFPLTHPSFTLYSILNIVGDIRQGMSQVHDTPFDPAHTNVTPYTYELPDGNSVEFGIERISLPESLFSSDLSKLLGAEEAGHIPYQKMIYQSISLCDSDIRKEMYNGIIVTGGNTLYTGFTDRLTNELSYLISQKLKIYSSNSSAERKFGPWIGGSILASLGTFHQLWMSKAEYDERGPSLVEKKCP